MVRRQNQRRDAFVDPSRQIIGPLRTRDKRRVVAILGVLWAMPALQLPRLDEGGERLVVREPLKGHSAEVDTFGHTTPFGVKTLMEKMLLEKTQSLHCGPVRVSRSHRLVRWAAPLLLMGLLVSSPTLANETKNFSLGLSAAIGGPFDSDSPDPGLGNSGFSAHFAWRTQPQSKVVVRVAKIDLGDEFLGNLFEPELGYINIGGEYTFREPYYTSGLYFGLGLYQLEGTVLGGTVLGGSDEQDTSLGAVFGVTADFSITSQFSFFADLSFHYADLDQAQFFGFLHLGIAYHF